MVRVFYLRQDATLGVPLDLMRSKVVEPWASTSGYDKLCPRHSNTFPLPARMGGK